MFYKRFDQQSQLFYKLILYNQQINTFISQLFIKLQQQFHQYIKISILTQHNIMKQQQQYQTDIRLNKVKEGFMIKRSRILKEWKQRWMVLTKTHLYSFVQKQVYKKPTQSIPLKQVSTIKSYYKNQYSRPQVIRIQSADTEFYLSAKNHQQKWSWMTAIQKMTDAAVCGNQQTSQSVNMIRETLRMTTAIRKTVNLKNNEKLCHGDSSEVPKDLMKRLKIVIDSNTHCSIVLPTLKDSKDTLETNKKITNIQQPNKTQPNTIQQKKSSQKSQQKQQPIIKQKIVEKIVYVPEIKQKIVYVPQIKQVIKTVYVQKSASNTTNQTSHNNLLTDEQTMTVLLRFFEEVMQMKCENPKPLIEFVVFLIFSQPQKYTHLVLSFSTLQSTQHAFSNAFLQVINQEIDEYKLNGYFQFIMVLYQNYDEYFYQNDLKLLIEILVRQIEMNRSNLNQFLIIGVLNAMAGKSWWSGVKHRREELVAVVSDVKAWTNDSQMRFAAQELLQKM